MTFEQTNADQIIQTVNEEVTSTNKEMQLIMQGDNKHPEYKLNLVLSLD